MKKAAVLVATTIAALAAWVSPASAAHTIFLDNACDKLVVDEVEAPDPNLIAADAGSTIVLTADSFCAPAFTFDGVDPATGENVCTLTQGNGIAVETDDVTLDLNGQDIFSTSDVAADADAAFACDVENAGVSVGGFNVTVTNSSTSVSLVDNFTANFDYKTRNTDPADDAANSSLVGLLVDPDGVPGSGDEFFNLKGGNAHGGGALAIDDSKGLTIDTVELADLSANGDNGVDLKFSSNITIQNSHIAGILTGVRVRSTLGVTLTGNTIESCGEALEALNSTFTVDPAASNTLISGAIAGFACPPPPAEG